MTELLLKLSNIRCKLDRNRYLENLDWEINLGEQWAVLGPNGSGKTALANILGKHLRFSAGSYETAAHLDPERDIAYVSFELQQDLYAIEHRRDISELCENAFDPGTLVEDIILQGQPRTENWYTFVDDLGVSQLLDMGFRYLSSGETRKVLIARGLMQKPALIVLDNPLEGLDRRAQAEIKNLIETLMDNGQQILLLLRRKEDLLNCISHVLLLDDLQLKAQGPIDKIQATIETIFPKPTPFKHLPSADPAFETFQPDTAIPLIELHNFRANYQGKTVLRNIDWTMRYGQHTSISGPNGCGKSTLLNMLCAENHMAYGQDVKLFGQRRGSGESIWDIKRRFGLVSNQLQSRYVRGWNCLEVVISGFFDSVGLYDNYGGLEERSAKGWLNALGIEELAKTGFHKLSFGQQRMVLLARAMVKYPPILLLDEPCTGLDDYNRTLILSAIDHIAAETDSHIIFVSHLASEIPDCINQELVFEPGENGLYKLVEVSA